MHNPDCHVKIKVPSPTTKSAYKAINARTKDGGGTYASVGHQYAFGNTEERYRIGILGVRAKGRRSQGPFDHLAGRGYVKKQRGKYYHALAQGARVTPFIVEATGALSPRALRYVRYLSGRARGKHARDGTKYGPLRASTKSFYVHHTQRLSKAAACGDVEGIHTMIRAVKQAVNADGSGAGARGF
jgi:hypothetical protein